MRHGNFSPPQNNCNQIGYSDPTYEAWKPWPLESVRERLTRYSDPTYEAWKLTILSSSVYP